MSKMISLSDRLRTAAGMVTAGNRVVDVGCDHGFVSIYLVQQGISPRCLAMDVRTGPLSAAEEHVAQWGLEAYIETRLSDGLKAYQAGEADTMLCCGMGGPLMAEILSAGNDKAKGLSELILQPQSEIPEFRVFLRENGYKIIKEDMVYEEGKYYFLIKAVPVQEVSGRAECFSEGGGVRAAVDGKGTDEAVDSQVLFDWFGQDNLTRRHPVLEQYLEYRMAGIDKIRRQLENGGKEDGNARASLRLQELEAEEMLLKQAMKYFE